MTPETLTRCMGLLEAKFAIKGRRDEWQMEAVRQMFALLLRQLPDEIGTRVVEQVLLQSPYVPDPADLWNAAARLASPFPTEDEAYAEVLDLADRHGIHAVPHAYRAIYLTGPPPFSHPLVAQAVAYCGGWEKICTGEAQMAEGLSKQFRGVYGRCAERWVSDVAAALVLPEAERPAHLFPAWKPYRIPVAWQPRRAVLLPPSPLACLPEPPLSPDYNAGHIARIREELPPFVEPRRPCLGGLDRVTREQLEAELSARIPTPEPVGAGREEGGDIEP